MIRLIRILYGPPPDDLVPTDWVRPRMGERKAGVVESRSETHAVVDWLNGKKEIIQLGMLRRIYPARDDLDSRRVGK